MELAATTKPDIPADLKNPTSENPEPEPIAIQDRLVLAMFVIVGITFGAVILMDLFIGFFR